MKAITKVGLLGCCLMITASCGDPSGAAGQPGSDKGAGALGAGSKGDPQCRSDADCSFGTVCESCSAGSATCVPGCRDKTTCPGSASECQAVVCVACPCPAQCVVPQVPPPAKTETDCRDNLDNDGDGAIDCQDSDCATSANCKCDSASGVNCCYPTCGPDEVLTCSGENICGYPCTCEKLPPPPPPTACKDDSQCNSNEVCESCGSTATGSGITGPASSDPSSTGAISPGTSGQCVVGCRTNATCVGTEICVTVQCFACPCPAQCMK